MRSSSRKGTRIRTGRWTTLGFALPALNEASLAEPSGIGGPAGRLAVWGRGGLLWTDPAEAAIDWDASGVATDLGVSANINRIDTICGAPTGPTIDGRYGQVVFSYNLNAGSIPPRSAFTAFVNGNEQTPVNVRIFRNWLYLTLAAPVASTDTVAFKYVKPSVDPVLRANSGGGAVASFQVGTTNIGGRTPGAVGLRRLVASAVRVPRLVELRRRCRRARAPGHA